MKIIKIPQEASFQCPIGTYRAVLEEVRERIDRNQVRFIYRIVDGEGNDTKYLVGKNYEPKLDSRSPLRTDLIKIRGRDFTEQEMSAVFNLENLVSTEVILSVGHSTNPGYEHPYVFITDFVHVPPGQRITSEIRLKPALN